VRVLPLLAGAPLTPSPDEARRVLVGELSRDEYAASRPTLLDRVASAFWDWLSGLRFAGVDGAGGLLLLVVLVVVAVVVAVLLVRHGVPRLTRRSERGAGLFEGGDDRDADDLRRAAAAAARAGDHTTAVAEQFRALARALDDRGLVAVTPGTTAHEVARVAGVALAGEREALHAAARSFDEVRYLDRPGTDEAWRRLVALDERLAAARVPA